MYLLHGLTDDHTTWMRRTSIERYAASRRIAVIMPAVGRSFYQNIRGGPQYWTYVSEELPQLMRRFFPLTSDRRHTFVAGNSMGGYGALRLAITQPGKFAAVASLSGALDLRRAFVRAGRPGSRVTRDEMMRLFCDGNLAPEIDLWQLAAQAHRNATASDSGLRELPKVYVSCGVEDALTYDSREFMEHLESFNWEVSYNEVQGGHDWSVWDSEIQTVIEWLPLSCRD